MTMTTSTWPFFRVALLVTGRGEEQFLPRLFQSLEAEGHCTFKIGRRVPQLGLRTSVKRKEKMVGTGKSITTRDEEIGQFARRCLSDGFHYIILIDDLEHDRKDHLKEIFERYRKALDTMF